MDLYVEDFEKIFIIYHEEPQLKKNYGWTLIGIPKEFYGSISDQEYFFINEDLFDRVKKIHQENNILLKMIKNGPNKNDSQYEVTDICVEKICKNKRTFVNN